MRSTKGLIEVHGPPRWRHSNFSGGNSRFLNPFTSPVKVGHIVAVSHHVPAYGLAAVWEGASIAESSVVSSQAAGISLLALAMVASPGAARPTYSALQCLKDSECDTDYWLIESMA